MSLTARDEVSKLWSPSVDYCGALSCRTTQSESPDESRPRGALPAAILTLSEHPELESSLSDGETECPELSIYEDRRQARRAELHRTVRVPSRRDARQYRLKIPNEGRQDPKRQRAECVRILTQPTGKLSFVILVGYQAQDTACCEPFESRPPTVLSSVSILVWELVGGWRHRDNGRAG